MKPLTIQGTEILWKPSEPGAWNGNTADPENDQGAKITTESTDSNQPEASTNDANKQNTPRNTPDTSENETGDVPLAVAETAAAYAAEAPDLPREESQAAATRRWRSTGIAEQVAVYRDRKREEYSRANPGSKRRDAHEYAWACAMAEFPPPGIEPVVSAEIAEPEPIPEPVEDPTEPTPAPTPSDQGVPGLGTIPADWPSLAANASLQVEISWVSANRLRVRDGSGVDLSKALSPAPSYSALSWLETSILFPSKFADISVKATQNQEDEAQHVRRERMAIEEIRALLAEMLEG